VEGARRKQVKIEEQKKGVVTNVRDENGMRLIGQVGKISKTIFP